MRSSRSASRALSVLALSIVGVVLVAGISPGATTPLTKQKAKKLFYTKAQADERFAPKGAPASDVACPGCVGENELGFDPATQAELNSSVTVEGWHEVGAPGQPGFTVDPSCLGPGNACWQNFGSVHNSVAFYKDPSGVVHLKGIPQCFADTDFQCAGPTFSTVFILPPGYHPAAQEAFPALTNAGAGLARVDITSTGAVVLRGPNFVSPGWLTLDGITFRAA